MPRVGLMVLLHVMRLVWGLSVLGSTLVLDLCRRATSTTLRVRGVNSSQTNDDEEQWLPLSQGQIWVTEERELLLQTADTEGQVAR